MRREPRHGAAVARGSGSMRSPALAVVLAAVVCAAPALTLVLAAAGCAGPAFDGSVYRGDGFAFQIAAAPPTWRRIEVSHAALAYRDDAHDATVAIDGRCGLDGEDVPLASLTQHLFLQFSAREIVSQEIVPLDRREALHTVLAAKLDGVPKTFDVWVMKKDGCVFDFYYIAAPARFEGGVPGFRRFVQGFATVTTPQAGER